MILGIHDGHDSGAAIVDKEKIFAVNEERLNREKYYRGFPKKSTKKVLELSKSTPEDIDKIAVAGIYRKRKRLLKLEKELEKILGPIDDKIVNVEHHLAHASSAYFTSGWNKGTVLTIDAAGDGISSAIYLANNNNLNKIAQSTYLNSLGDFYASITEMLGFKPMRHEGKIMALGAYHNSDNYYDFSNCITLNGLTFNNKMNVTGSKSAKKISKKINFPIHRKKEISNLLRKGKLKHKLSIKAIKAASSAQKHLEKLLRDLSNNILENDEIDEKFKRKIAYSGGLAQNVKGNSILRKKFAESYIFPHMGDGGLALGAALYLQNNYNGSGNYEMKDSVKNVYLGPKYSNPEVREVLEDSDKLRFRKSNNIIDEVGNLISEGNIVSLFQGRMEYGPRALGNRSILSDPSDVGLKEKLNNSLGREPFQPFAPTILDSRADDYLKSSEENKFMTMSFDVEDKAKEDLEATIHVDGTTRPQIISEEDNYSFYNIIKKFEELNGIGAVLNTSFNMHGEPIVCSPRDAVKSFLRSDLDYLVIEDFLVEKKKK